MALKCLFISFLINAQTYSVFESDSLFKNKKFEAAATSYERVFFFTKDNSERVYALIKRAECLKSLSKFYEAYKSLVRINNYDINDSLRCYSNYQLALNLYLSGFYNDAERYCAKNYSIPINSKEYKSSVFLHGIIYNELTEYKKAQLKFKEYNSLVLNSPSSLDSVNSFIDHYYSQKNLPKLKSLKKARKLSSVIPGAGLFYAGKPGKALANIGFQLFAVGYTGANVYFQNYVTAATAGLFMIRAFYTGGINQLNEIIPANNSKKSGNFNSTFKLKYLQKLQDYEAKI